MIIVVTRLSCLTMGAFYIGLYEEKNGCRNNPQPILKTSDTYFTEMILTCL